jgi:nicotinamide mononucleotide transporter
MLELLATLVTVASVLLSNFRSTVQYPVGILGTILFFFVFYSTGLYSSASLQVVFTLVQLYGWWFWLRGDRGKRPQITTIAPIVLVGAMLGAVVASIGLGQVVGLFSGAAMPLMDAQIFGFSVLAQFLLDRKKIESWIVWAVVNVASIYVYFGMGLKVTGFLYVGLLIDVWEKGTTV